MCSSFLPGSRLARRIPRLHVSSFQNSRRILPQTRLLVDCFTFLNDENAKKTLLITLINMNIPRSKRDGRCRANRFTGETTAMGPVVSASKAFLSSIFITVPLEWSFPVWLFVDIIWRNCWSPLSLLPWVPEAILSRAISSVLLSRLRRSLIGLRPTSPGLLPASHEVVPRENLWYPGY